MQRNLSFIRDACSESGSLESGFFPILMMSLLSCPC